MQCFTVSSRLPNSAGFNVICSFALLAFSAGARTGARADSVVDLELVPPAPGRFDAGDVQPTAIAPGGQTLVFGRFEHPDFAIESIDQLAVVAPDGRRLPLTIDSESIFFEFDRIVSIEFFFTVDDALTLPADTPFRLKWGGDVRGDNVRVGRIVLDPSKRDRYLQCRPRTGGDALPPDASLASIEVIADSTADFYFLLYLLPMAAIFVVLTVRKIRASRSLD